MAERRMFAKSIVLSDVFLDMPLSARCLYFTLGMLADDEGFIGSPKAIMRQCGASQDDMAILLQKRYVLAFDNGVIVIKHWKMNNYLQKDRIKPTTYLEELSTLMLDDKGAYTEKATKNPDFDNAYTECIQDVYKMDTQSSIDKSSIDKSNKNIYGDSVEENFEKLWSLYPRKHGKGSVSKKSKKEIFKIGYEKMEKCIELFKADMKQNETDMKYYPYGSTFFNSGYKDYLEMIDKQEQKKTEEPTEENDDEEWSDERWEEEFRKRGI